jgi:hypothetical protein
MEKRIISLFLAFSCCLYALPTAWINEIHYDNAGVDVNEFVEVVVACPEECNLGDLTLYMYNGYDGRPYCLDCISDFVPGERVGPYQFYTWHRSGIQNDMEGMILVYFDDLLDIIAYEGTFTGTREPALGLVFPDVGVAETSGSSADGSIYLTGFPGDPWAYTEHATPGSPNQGQILTEIPTPVELSCFYADLGAKSVTLHWRSESETENSHWQLYRDGNIIANIHAAGTSSAPNDYVYQDYYSRPGTSCFYSLSHVDYSGNECFCDTLKVRFPADPAQHKPFLLKSPFPNPCNPGTVLSLTLFRSAHVHIDLYDLWGRHVLKIYDQMATAGELRIPVDLRHLAGGRYILRCICDGKDEQRLITLLK